MSSCHSSIINPLRIKIVTSTHTQGVVIRRTLNMYSAKADGKKSPTTMMSTAMAAMINSKAILTNTAETRRRRGRPHRTLVLGPHVTV